MNKVLFGLKNVHIAFETESGYGTPTAINGAVSFSASPEGDTSEFYADDMVYFVSSANNGYSGELVVALLPDAIKAEMFGWSIDAYGTLVEVADGIPKKFALMGEISGDAKNRRFVYYSVQATRPDNSAKTKEGSIEIEGETIPIKIMPKTISEKLVNMGMLELSDTNATEYNGFFEAVYMPYFGTIPKLASLSFATVTLSPTFSGTVYSYTATTSNATNTITATAVNEDDTVVILNGATPVASGESATWADGENTVTITVTSGTKSTVYTVVVTKSVS